MEATNYLKLAGVLSFVASALHLAIIIGGAEWYRFFGAGEQAAIQAEQGGILIHITTAVLASIFFAWGLYALSGAQLIPTLPLLRVCLVLITFVYLARGLLGFVVPFITDQPSVTELGLVFWMWSSFICSTIGFIHLKGVIGQWSALGSGF